MYTKLSQTLEKITEISVSNERKEVLQPLIDFIQNKVNSKDTIRLNFICTHNSRRSHLSQIPNVFCYSGGTEATAMFEKVSETLTNQGFEILKLSENTNPVYALKYDANEAAVIGFSKKYDDSFNPEKGFAAIMTCSSADEGCPFIFGAEARIPIRYEDPKVFDGTDLMNAKYEERSLEIASELFYVFSQIKK
jgi:arsenate reductase